MPAATGPGAAGAMETSSNEAPKAQIPSSSLRVLLAAAACAGPEMMSCTSTCRKQTLQKCICQVNVITLPEQLPDAARCLGAAAPSPLSHHLARLE